LHARGQLRATRRRRPHARRSSGRAARCHHREGAAALLGEVAGGGGRALHVDLDAARRASGEARPGRRSRREGNLMGHPLFATKSVDQLRSDAERGTGLRRALGALDLTMLGIGAIIGTGIFVLTGHAAASNAGPAIPISFVIAGVASAFAGLCYSEMASMIP